MDYLKIEVSRDHPLLNACQEALLDQIWQKNPCLPLTGRLLDIGPGKGFYTRYFLRRGFQVSCLDIDPSLRASFEALGCEFRVADARAEKLPYEDETFDVVWCSHVIEHLPNPLHFLEELRRSVKIGGFVILRTPDVRRVKFDFWTDPTHLHPFTLVSLTKLVTLANLETVWASNCDLPEIRGLHRVRGYRWAPWLLFKGINLLAIAKRTG